MIKSQGVLSANAAFFFFPNIPLLIVGKWLNFSFICPRPSFPKQLCFPRCCPAHFSFWLLSWCHRQGFLLMTVPMYTIHQFCTAECCWKPLPCQFNLPAAPICSHMGGLLCLSAHQTCCFISKFSFRSSFDFHSFPFHNFIIAFWTEEIQSWKHFDILIHYSFIPKNRMQISITSYNPTPHVYLELTERKYINCWKCNTRLLWKPHSLRGALTSEDLKAKWLLSVHSLLLVLSCKNT